LKTPILFKLSDDAVGKERQRGQDSNGLLPKS
jgi:hypothetical protein